MPKPNWAGGANGAVQGASAGSTFGPIGAVVGGITGGLGGLYGGGGGGGSSGNSGSSSGPRSMGEMRGNPNPQSGSFWSGTDPVDYQQTLLAPEQIPLYEQSVNAGLNRGAGGAFGDSADYYRDLLSNDPADFDMFARPEMRRFNEDIVPGLAEQFAGMGSGGLSSSGFRNAAVSAGTDLSERLGAIRANLRQQGAQGLFQAGQQGLQHHLENIHVPGQPGFLQGAASGIGQGIAQMGGDFMKSGGGSGGVSGGGSATSSGTSGSRAPSQSISRGGGVPGNGGFSQAQMGIPGR